MGEAVPLTVSIQRPDATKDGDFSSTSDTRIIRRGDLLHVDLRISYLRLHTDTQQHAYVLRAGEIEAPQCPQAGPADGQSRPRPVDRSIRDGAYGQRGAPCNARGGRFLGHRRHDLCPPDWAPRACYRAAHRTLGPARRGARQGRGPSSPEYCALHRAECGGQCPRVERTGRALPGRGKRAFYWRHGSVPRRAPDPAVSNSSAVGSSAVGATRIAKPAFNDPAVKGPAKAEKQALEVERSRAAFGAGRASSLCQLAGYVSAARRTTKPPQGDQAPDVLRAEGSFPKDWSDTTPS